MALGLHPTAVTCSVVALCSQVLEAEGNAICALPDGFSKLADTLVGDGLGCIRSLHALTFKMLLVDRSCTQASI